VPGSNRLGARLKEISARGETMNQSNRSLVGTCGVVTGLVVVAMGLCGGCLFLGILGQQAIDATKAKSRESFVDAAKAAVVEHFHGDVRIVSATLDRPEENGFLVAGQYVTPGDHARDFLATVVPTDASCRVAQLIVDGEVVLPKP
jgi:hypothetical protein